MEVGCVPRRAQTLRLARGTSASPSSGVTGDCKRVYGHSAGTIRRATDERGIGLLRLRDGNHDICIDYVPAHVLSLLGLEKDRGCVAFTQPD